MRENTACLKVSLEKAPIEPSCCHNTCESAAPANTQGMPAGYGGGSLGRPVQLLLLLGIVLAGVLVAPRLLANEREGELVFSQESVDLGQVPLGTLAPYRFMMRNVGSKPVNIARRGKITVLEGC